MGKLVVHDAIGAIDVSGNLIKIRSMNGHLANGTIHVAGVVDASGDQPDYRLDAQVTNAAPARWPAYSMSVGEAVWRTSPPN